MLIPALKLVLLERIVERGSQAIANPKQSYGVGVCVSSLRDVSQASWKDILEPLILHDHILRKDPAGAYARMDLESRDLYRNKIVEIAEYSDFSEMEVASEALALARRSAATKGNRSAGGTAMFAHRVLFACRRLYIATSAGGLHAAFS